MTKIAKVATEKPFTLFNHFHFSETSLDITGKPTFDDYSAAGDFIQRSHRASGFWLADWLRYGEGRRDWEAKLSQAVDSSGLSEKTLKNVRAVGAIEAENRQPGVEFSHHAEVAGMDAAEQREWLERAHTEGWTLREFRQMIRAAKRPRVIDGQATMAGFYRVWYADPPWSYGDSAPTEDGSLGKAERHYPTMSIEELCALPVEAHTTKNAVLFLWVTAPLLLQNPGPREVIEAWGFEYKTGAVWDKVVGMYGHYFHIQHEHLLVCTRGSCVPDVPVPSPKSLFTERRTAHSKKPTAVRKVIERLYTRGPYVELFAREPAEGWETLGNDARLWGGIGV